MRESVAGPNSSTPANFITAHNIAIFASKKALNSVVDPTRLIKVSSGNVSHNFSESQSFASKVLLIVLIQITSDSSKWR